MRAVIYTDPTGIDALSVSELPDPTPGAGHVRIAVEAATINPADLAAVAGAYGPDWPEGGIRTQGWDLAGVVDAVGEGVEPELVGRRVLGFSQWYDRRAGTQASSVVLGRDGIAVVGDGIPSVALTTFGLNGLTALQALDAAEVPAGGSVVVTGSSGAVGGFVIELARHRGLTVHPVRRDLSVLDGVVADAAVFTSPVDQGVVAAVKDGGTVTSVTAMTAKPEAERGIRFQRVGVDTDRAGLEQVAALAEAGVLTAHVGQTFPVERVQDAYRAAKGPGTDRVVLTF
jgi:NADPH2:quinone reductase